MGHEVQEHLDGKQVIDEFWVRRGFNVFLEAGCDALVLKIYLGRFIQMFNEFERSTKNVLNNFKRNQRHATPGAKFLILVPDERMRVAVRRILRRGLPAESNRKIGIALLSSLNKWLSLVQL